MWLNLNSKYIDKTFNKTKKISICSRGFQNISSRDLNIIYN